MSERNELFQTYEGMFRTLVEQVIDGEKTDWFLIEHRHIPTLSRLEAHAYAVRQFVGREVRFTGLETESGYTFTTVK